MKSGKHLAILLVVAVLSIGVVWLNYFAVADVAKKEMAKLAAEKFYWETQIANSNARGFFSTPSGKASSAQAGYNQKAADLAKLRNGSLMASVGIAMVAALIGWALAGNKDEKRADGTQAPPSST